MNKPGQIQAMAIYTLIIGILNICVGIFFCFAFFIFLGFLPGIYSIVTGILEIIYATKILPTPIKTNQPAQYIAIS